MEKIKVYTRVVGAVCRYNLRFHPYMTVWIVIWVIGGIYLGINLRSSIGLIVMLIMAMAPIIVKSFFSLLEKSTSGRKADFELRKCAKRERFLRYLDEHINGRLEKK